METGKVVYILKGYLNVEEQRFASSSDNTNQFSIWHKYFYTSFADIVREVHEEMDIKCNFVNLRLEFEQDEGAIVVDC